jgi:hypothetical protein
MKHQRTGFIDIHEWHYEMRVATEFATVVGDYRYNDRWSTLSLAHVAQQTEDLKSWLPRF